MLAQKPVRKHKIFPEEMHAQMLNKSVALKRAVGNFCLKDERERQLRHRPHYLAV